MYARPYLQMVSLIRQGKKICKIFKIRKNSFNSVNFDIILSSDTATLLQTSITEFTSNASLFYLICFFLSIFLGIIFYSEDSTYRWVHHYYQKMNPFLSSIEEKVPFWFFPMCLLQFLGSCFFANYKIWETFHTLRQSDLKYISLFHMPYTISVKKFKPYTIYSSKFIISRKIKWNNLLQDLLP